MPQLQEFKSPNRKPWLLVLAGIVVLGAILWIMGRRGEGQPDSTDVTVDPTTEAEEVPPGVNVVYETTPDDPGAPETPTEVIPPPQPPANVSALVEKARAQARVGALVEARRAYHAALTAARHPEVTLDLQRKITELNLTLALSPRQMPEKIDYVVQRGDSVERIARRHKTTVDQLKLGNDLHNVNRINIGDRLRVLTGDRRIVVSKSQHSLKVFLNDQFFIHFDIGTGKFGKTPVGTFVISDRIKEPVWWRPDGREIPFGDPENILGTRWLAIKPTGDTPKVRGYGIHGTWDNSSIGKNESAGCVRMRNQDVEKLFALIPNGTPVTVAE